MLSILYICAEQQLIKFVKFKSISCELLSILYICAEQQHLPNGYLLFKTDIKFIK